MSGFKLSARSEERLTGVHYDLVKIVRRAIEITAVDFMVVEGLRTIERQRQLVAQGFSKTLRSRHLTGHAVDLAPLLDGEPRWDWPGFHPIATAMKGAATQLNIPVEWGGDWKSFRDGPHWQLPWREYPANTGA